MGLLVRAIILAVHNLVEKKRQLTNSLRLALEIRSSRNQGSREMEVIADQITRPIR
jgi:hypothetical protein